MYISIIIPTYNRVETLKEALYCIERQQISTSEFEVIVIDDASTDTTANFLAHYSPNYKFTYFIQKSNQGPAIARNVGILAAKGQIILTLNDDTLLAPDALAIHIGIHQSLGENAVSLLGRFDLPHDFSKTLWGYMLQNSDLLFRYPLLKHNHVVYSHSVWWSCHISTPRKELLEAGLFDEQFTAGAWGAEDQELGYRLVQNGIPVLYRSDIHATHMHRLTVDGFVSMSLARGSGGVLLFSKHGIPCHYCKDITEEDIAFWKNIPPRLQNVVQHFQQEIKKTENINLPQKEDPPPYYNITAYSTAKNIAHALYQMRTRDILSVFEKCSEQLESLLEHINTGSSSMEDAARVLYPLCLILRFYYDTIAICSTERIKLFTKKHQHSR